MFLVAVPRTQESRAPPNLLLLVRRVTATEPSAIFVVLMVVAMPRIQTIYKPLVWLPGWLVDARRELDHHDTFGLRRLPEGKGREGARRGHGEIVRGVAGLHFVS